MLTIPTTEADWEQMPNTTVPYIVRVDLHGVTKSAHRLADKAMTELLGAEKQGVRTTWLVQYEPCSKRQLHSAVVLAFKVFRVSARSATIFVDRVGGKPFVHEVDL